MRSGSPPVTGRRQSPPREFRSRYLPSGDQLGASNISGEEYMTLRPEPSAAAMVMWLVAGGRCCAARVVAKQMMRGRIMLRIVTGRNRGTRKRNAAQTVRRRGPLRSTVLPAEAIQNFFVTLSPPLSLL